MRHAEMMGTAGGFCSLSPFGKTDPGLFCPGSSRDSPEGKNAKPGRLAFAFSALPTHLNGPMAIPLWTFSKLWLLPNSLIVDSEVFVCF